MDADLLGSPSLDLLNSPPLDSTNVDYFLRLVKQLAEQTSYSLSSSPEAKKALNIALYGWAYEDRFAHLLFGKTGFLRDNSLEDLIGSEFSLAKDQKERAGEGDLHPAACGYIFKPGETVYRCRECAMDGTCVMCSKCFHSSVHSKHDVLISLHGSTGTSCCDCGDPEAYKEGCETGCTHHPSSSVVNQNQTDSMDVDSKMEEIREATCFLHNSLCGIFDWALQTLGSSPAPLEMRAPPTERALFESIRNSAAHVTEDQLAAISESSTFKSPDYLPPVPIPLPVFHPTLPHMLRQDQVGVGGPTYTSPFPMAPVTTPPTTTRTYSAVYPNAPRPQNSVLPLPTGAYVSDLPDFMGSTSSRPMPIPVSTGAVPVEGPFGVILYNDEKHDFRTVADQIHLARSAIPPERVSELVELVDDNGRAAIHHTSSPYTALKMAQTFQAITLTCMVKTSLQFFEEEVAYFVLRFLKDLMSVRVGKPGIVEFNTGKGKGKERNNMFTSFQEMIAMLFLEHPAEEEELRWTRFQRLLAMDPRLWKSLRLFLAQLYVQMMGLGAQIKIELASQFAELYALIASYYTISDREPDLSILLFGVQVFTVPSIAAQLVENHGMFRKPLLVLFALYNNVINLKKGVLHVLPTLPKGVLPRVDPASNIALKQKRYIQIFHDLGQIISAPPAQRVICSSDIFLEEFTTFMDLFTGMNSVKRAVGTHVEYETEWMAAFNTTIQTSRVIRIFGQAFKESTPAQLVRALSSSLTKIGTSSGPLNSQMVQWCGQAYQVLVFKVETGEVSFHHPLTWLWSEMARNVEILDRKRLESIGLRDIRQVCLSRTGALHFLAALEGPLRVLVLIAQIQAGVWVRNGYAMRTQLMNYREFALRETTYDQDIYMLQVSLLVLDPSHILVAMVHRFSVLDWLVNDTQHEVYSDNQAITVLEEMSYIFIQIIGDLSAGSGAPPKDLLRSELIHVLALDSMAHSDIVKKSVDRFEEGHEMDVVLKEVADFIPPIGTTDQGKYRLKKTCLGEVNPYWSRYTRNQRDEAEKIVTNYLRSLPENRFAVETPVYEPPPLSITIGPFAEFDKVYKSPVLHQIVFFFLRAGTGKSRAKLMSELLVNQSLFLAMICYQNAPEMFSQFAGSRMEKMDHSLIELLVVVEEDASLKSCHAKAIWLLNKLQLALGDIVSRLRKISPQIKDPEAEDQKKRAAKARQAAIMAQFSKARSAFINSTEYSMEETPPANSSKETTADLCIVCQEVLNGEQPFGSLAFVQASHFIRATPIGKDEYLQELQNMPSDWSEDASHLRPFGLANVRTPTLKEDPSGDGLARGFPSPCTIPGSYISSCGHTIHMRCFSTYMDSVHRRHQLQAQQEHPENVDRNEFVCPLCKSLGNILIPEGIVTGPVLPDSDIPLDRWAALVCNKAYHAQELGISDASISRFEAAVNHVQGSLPLHIGLGPWKIAPRPILPITSSINHSDMLVPLTKTFAIVWLETAKGVGYLPKDIIGYTVSALEISLRGTIKTGPDLPDSTLRLLKNLLSLLALLLEGSTDLDPTQNRTMGGLYIYDHLGGAFISDPTMSIDLFEYDPLTCVVEAAAVVPHYLNQVTAFAFYTEVLKVFFGILDIFTGVQNTESFLPTDAEDDVAREDYIALSKIRHLMLPPASDNNPTIEQEIFLGKYIYLYSLPFLRRSAILQAVACPPPEDPESDWDEEMPPPASELSRLLQQFKIPHPKEVFNGGTNEANAILTHLVSCVSRDGVFRSVSTSTNLNINLPLFNLRIPEEIAHRFTSPIALHTPGYRYYLQHPHIYELLGIARQATNMVEESLVRKCTRGKCQSVPRNPALCLFCGDMVCFQSFCCMETGRETTGECNAHMWGCGGNSGLFMMLKRLDVLLLYAGKGAFHPSPYLDVHGEVDCGPRRSTRAVFPQFLHKGRYDELRRIWMTHGFGTAVARKLEGNTDRGGWETL